MNIVLVISIVISIILFWLYFKTRINKKSNYSIDKKIVTPIKQLKYIHFTELDFNPVPNQIIYIESLFNENINKYISTFHDDFLNLSKTKGFDFFYLPIKKEKLKSEEFIAYYYPQLQKSNLEVINEINYSYESLLSHTLNNSELLCGFIRFRSKNNDIYNFSYYEIDDSDLLLQFNNYLHNTNLPTCLYNIGHPENDSDLADFKFGIEANNLIEEVKLKIDKLKMMGLGEALLKSIVFERPQLSKLFISKDFRIILPDYNNMEIKLHPLSKAVYFLFLKHPEGIYFKHLTDYREELLKIYLKLSNQSDIEKIYDSILDLTDPTKNAINEKCSRIKEAFICVLNPDISDNYIIKGNRGEVKSIVAAKELLEFEEDF